MDSEKIEYVSEFIYNMPLSRKKAEIENIDDSDILHLIMYNYNWDDGFEIPRLVLQNHNCEMSTALMMFFLAGGDEILADRQLTLNNENSRDNFVIELYNSIIAGKYMKGDIWFEPPLTKVELYKLKKVLADCERVFVESMGNRKVEMNV